MRVFRSRPFAGLVALFLVLGAASCGKKQQAQAPAAGHGPAMWHVSDADSDVYLFGSFHLLPNGVNWQTREMKAAFDKSVLLVLETDTRSENPQELASLIEKYGIAPPDRPLRGRMTPEQRAAFDALATKLKLDPAQLDPFQPWYAATILTVQYAQMKGMAAERGVEQTLIAQANAGGKPLAFLETLEEQIRFLADLPQDTQMQMLTATFEELESADADMQAMQNAWASGDTQGMSRLFDKSIKEVPALKARLITDRNKRWADEIARLVASRSGPVFIAVGAGHLVGDDSVVALLRQRGLKVEGP